MESRATIPVPWVRALFAGSFAFFLGTAGHVMADGLLPGTAFLVVLSCSSSWSACRCWRGRRHGCGCSGYWWAVRPSSTSA